MVIKPRASGTPMATPTSAVVMPMNDRETQTPGDADKLVAIWVEGVDFVALLLVTDGFSVVPAEGAGVAPTLSSDCSESVNWRTPSSTLNLLLQL